MCIVQYNPFNVALEGMLYASQMGERVGQEEGQKYLLHCSK